MKGYIAIITSIILMMVVISVALSLGIGAFLGRFDTRELEMKKLSYFLSYGCQQVALLKLASGQYEGDETISVESYRCRILPIESTPPYKIINTQATVDGITTNLKLKIDDYTLKTISFEEVSGF